LLLYSPQKPKKYIQNTCDAAWQRWLEGKKAICFFSGFRKVPHFFLNLLPVAQQAAVSLQHQII
jgi:hypothetical protein